MKIETLITVKYLNSDKVTPILVTWLEHIYRFMFTNVHKFQKYLQIYILSLY